MVAPPVLEICEDGVREANAVGSSGEPEVAAHVRLRRQMHRARANMERNLDECHGGELVLESLPQNMGVGCTVKCNLKCIMCPSRDRPVLDMDEDTFARIVDCLKGAREVCWNEAGETFASSRTPFFVAMMKRYRTETSFLSSNFMLVDRWIDEILDCGMTDILVSIDTADPRTYESIRRGASWDRLIRNIELLNARKRALGRITPRLTFSFVLLKSSLPNMVPFVEFAHRHGAAGVQFLKLLASPTGIHETEEPDPQQAYRYYKKALRRARQLGLNVVTNAFHMQKALAEVVAEEAQASAPSGSTTMHSIAPADDRRWTEATLPIPLPALHRRNPDTHILRDDPEHLAIPFCPSPWVEAAVLADGAVRACCFGPKNMGYLNGATFRDIWNGPEYQRLRRRLLLRDFSICGNCIYIQRKLAAEKPSESFRKINALILDLERRLARPADHDEVCESLFTQIVEVLRIARLNVERIDRCKESIAILAQAREAVRAEIETAAAESHRPRTFFAALAPAAYWDRDRFEAIWLRFRPEAFRDALLETNVCEIDGLDVLADLLGRQPTAISCAMVWNALATFHAAERAAELLPHQQRVVREAVNILRHSAECVEYHEKAIERLVAFIERGKGEIAYLRRTQGLSLSEPTARRLDRTLWGLFYSGQVLYHNTPARMRPGETVKVDLRVANTSAVAWPTQGIRSVCVAYRWHDGMGHLHEVNGLRTALPGSYLRPFRPTAVRAILRAPDTPGRYTLKWDFVYETIAWFQDRFCPPLEIDVEVVGDSEDDPHGHVRTSDVTVTSRRTQMLAAQRDNRLF